MTRRVRRSRNANARENPPPGFRIVEVYPEWQDGADEDEVLSPGDPFFEKWLERPRRATLPPDPADDWRAR